MKDQLRLITLFVTVIMATSVLSAQGPVFDPLSGKTVYRTNDGGIVVYTPTTGGSEIDVINGEGGRTTVDCSTAPEQCRDILEDAADGTPPFMPEEPAEGGDDTGGDEPAPSTQSGSQSTQFFKEFKSYSKANRGKMYYRSKSGKWSVIKDWKAMHKAIMGNYRKR